MGASNVAAVYTTWSTRLSDRSRAFRLLVYMALTSRDDDKPPRFWGGREALASIGLGRDLSDATQRHRAFVAVSDALAELDAAGAIDVAARGRAGRNSEYLLNLWITRPADQGEPVADVITAQAHPVSARRLTLTNRQAHPENCQGEPVPEEEKEDLGPLQEEDQRRSATSRAAVHGGSVSGY